MSSGFPFIFRGALDVRATTINEEMKLAATRALAALAKEDVPDSVLPRLRRGAPGVRPRIHHSEALRSARADLGGLGRGAGRHGNRRRAESGGPQQYREELERRLGKAHEVMRVMIHKAQSTQARRLPRRRGTRKSCAPARSCWTRKIATRSCWARKRRSRREPQELRLHLDGVRSSIPQVSPRVEEYIEEFYRLRQRKWCHAHGGRSS